MSLAVEVALMRLAAIISFILATYPAMSAGQSFRIIDSETGESFGPFDMSSDDSAIISGKTYHIVRSGNNYASGSPEDVLASYLMTSSWPDRIQYVVKSDGIVDRMRMYYDKPILKPENVSIVSTGKIYQEEEDTAIFAALREYQIDGLPHSVTVSYVMRNVDGSWLVDWDETDTLIEAENKEKAKRAASALGLSDAKIMITTLNLKKRGNHTDVEALLNNQSDAEISSLSITFMLYDADGDYISRGHMFPRNIKSKAGMTRSC